MYITNLWYISISGKYNSLYCLAFHKANEIALTRLKWLSAFTINLKPYENILNKLSEDLGKARITTQSIKQFYDFASKQDYMGIIKGLKGDIVALLKDHILWKITWNCMPYAQK